MSLWLEKKILYGYCCSSSSRGFLNTRLGEAEVERVFFKLGFFLALFFLDVDSDDSCGVTISHWFYMIKDRMGENDYPKGIFYG